MFWRTLFADRRVWLAALTGAFAVVASRYAVSDHEALEIVVRAGYWIVLALTVLWLRAVWLEFGREARAWRPRREHLLAGALIAVASSMLLAHERYGMKVLADEELLMGTSMSMHQDRLVGYPVRATDVQGPFQILQRVLDKRPFFYPFLVSLAHDFTGYRPENAFYVNTVVGFAFLALIYVIGRRLGGSPWAGAMLVLLYAGLPLLSQQMKGGGFDLLNVTMIAVVLVLAWRYAERRSATAQEAVWLAAALLAFTRYESILFLLPVAGLTLWVWRREQRVTLTWTVIALPLFLIFTLLHKRVFALTEGSWELAGKPGATTVFGWHYVGDNLGHALAFFFDTTGYMPNSPFFGALGVLAAPFFALWMVRSTRARPMAPMMAGTACVGAGLFGIAALLMAYFWGQFDHPVIHRLSLPVHLLMAVAIAAVGGVWLRRRGWRLACAAAVVALVAYSLPSMARRAYTTAYSPAVEMEWRREFLGRYPEKDYLFIDNDATFWIAHRVPATPARQAKARQEGLMYHLRNGSFSAVYALQRFHVDPQTGAHTLDPADDLGPEFELEPVWERRIQTLFIGRISRVTAIRRGQDVAHAGLVRPTPPPNRSGEEWEAAKKAFVDNWLKQLP